MVHIENFSMRIVSSWQRLFYEISFDYTPVDVLAVSTSTVRHWRVNHFRGSPVSGGVMIVGFPAAADADFLNSHK